MYIQQIIPHVYLLFVFTENYWSDAHNRRKFFIDFATQKGFDPLVPINWENIQYKEILEQVKKKEFEQKRGRGRWKGDIEVQSKQVGSSPLHHYKGNLSKAIKDSFPEIGVHISLLLFPFLFLTICFDNSNRPKTTSTYVHTIVILHIYFFIYYVFTGNYWRDAHNRRKFFVDFATQKGFDPLVSTNWENIQYKEILKKVKGKKNPSGEEEERQRFKM